MEFSDLTRQRVDYSPSGDSAILTVTLDDGSIHRFEASTTEEEVERLASAFLESEEAIEVGCCIGAKLGKLTPKAYRELPPEQRAEIDKVLKRAGWAGEMMLGKLRGRKSGGFFSSVGRAFKSVVGSKVFQVAAVGLAGVATGGLAIPAAVAASAALGVGGKLMRAELAANAGAKKAAQKLAADAANDAKRIARGNATATASLLKVANEKRHGLGAVIARTVSASAKPTPAPRSSSPSPAPRVLPRPAPPASSKPLKVLDAARAGRLRSNHPGPISASALAQAAAAGRVFWVI